MKIIRRFAGLLCCTLLFSCNTEEALVHSNPDLDGTSICFGVVPPLQVQTKAAAHPQLVNEQRFVLRSPEGPETLSVLARVSEGIEASAGQGPQVLTRATPVTQAAFYDAFHVLAYWKENGTLASGFYMNENATDRGTVWGTEQAYYWLDASHSFQFYAWAPIDAAGLTTPATPQSKDLVYTVPADATQQKDLVVAASAELPGNANATVPLTFNHICTAVRFETGSQMQAGTIKSVALKGVTNAGTYNMATGAWTLGATTADFTQVLNMATTGSEAAGTAITPAAATFMMLPQTLAAGAEMEVVFTTPSHVDLVLTASLEDVAWAMGTTVTYRLSITPQFEYDLDFVSQPQVQDAHYVIYPIIIKNVDPEFQGGWQLTSNDPTHVTFVESGEFVHEMMQTLVDAGYWVDGHQGTATLTSSTAADSIKVYVFLTENATQADRNITLSLQPAQGGGEVRTFSFTQYCPAWNNGIGVERIEEGDYPWGFNWTSFVEYQMPRNNRFFGIFDRGTDGIPCLVNLGNWRNWRVRLKFDEVTSFTAATHSDDGKANTWAMYNYQGVGNAALIMEHMGAWAIAPNSVPSPDPSQFAARACAMKNKYTVSQVSESGVYRLYRLNLAQNDMVWYLPARNQAPLMNDNLVGDYWTSTAINGSGNNAGTQAYKYTAGGTTSPEDRSSVLHVRAVRTMN